jgi:hypothetical protein
MEDKYFSSILTAVSRMNSQAQSPRLSPIQHYNRSVHQQYGMNHKPPRPSPLVLTSEPSKVQILEMTKICEYSQICLFAYSKCQSILSIYTEYSII